VTGDNFVPDSQVREFKGIILNGPLLRPLASRSRGPFQADVAARSRT
jgi:hypothetical protein